MPHRRGDGRAINDVAEGVGVQDDEVLLTMKSAVDTKINSTPHKPLFSFGVITDIQYADIDNGRSFLGVPRYYRHALIGVQRAVQAWNKKGDLSFAIHFGDLVDGFCPKEKSRTAFNTVLSELAKFQGGHVYHMIGNHCLYNLPRQELNQILHIPTSKSEQRSYYSFSPMPEFLFVALDGYDISTLGWPTDHPHFKAAMELLNRRNPNDEKNSPVGLRGVNQRFVKFNGAVGEKQLEWMETKLQEAQDAGQKAQIRMATSTSTTIISHFEELVEWNPWKCSSNSLSHHSFY
uniref:Calcineurin-like phosphoesterase domain-containing protein n=1 Tax=Physcomitrium patens TaxID=3218 RepID=A0A7I4AXK9_PHYPA